MQNKTINTNYLDYIKNIEKLISKIFLNIKQIIVLLFYIFYKQPKINRKDRKVREYIYIYQTMKMTGIITNIKNMNTGIMMEVKIDLKDLELVKLLLAS
jgi:hypothetical protein